MSALDKSRYPKQIMDAIHGLIDVDPELVDMIDTLQFQRLRDLSQMGTSYYVFPGASHRRFEHSIGTAHLAGLLLDNIDRLQPHLGLGSREKLLVKMAGLCHDLGHGPFSHAFDTFIDTTLPDSTWTHEQGSIMMLERMVDDNHIDVERDEIRFISELIDPTHNAPTRTEHKFLYDIVSNSKNSIDVDKFDYLQRDSHCMGLKASYDANRLIHMARVIDDEICYPAKHAFNIYQLFHTRYSLHKTVYQHKVSKSIEYMITDAFIAADSHLGISSSINDPDRFLYMTDSIVQQIERSSDSALARSRKILKDVRTRNLYKMVGEVVMSCADGERIGDVTAADISTRQPAGGKLRPEGIIIQKFHMNYAMKDRNPVGNVRFYESHNPMVAFPLCDSHVSMMIPGMFSECVLRVFVRDATDENVACAREAMSRLLREHSLSQPNPVYSRPCTPSPRKAKAESRLTPGTTWTKLAFSDTKRQRL
ncbi:unnamed protein product (mitochondrion) [Plasmodiophora brassicae]|uniref:HD domain-containing protein n=1 Tax=Plasmodiophora brassicae TaxID=37360 RepID=A0A0G4ISJ8_PLABS|nr:hypothetical protein PBRA_006349 [Plasmodiophora brassicae]SPQ95189.1 unnamed protein product [Plasmodiophora brassicae]